MNRIIKIGVLVDYGKDYQELLINSLNSEDGEEKLKSIENISKSNLDINKKLFLIQKLLSMPKHKRKSIANQLIEKNK